MINEGLPEGWKRKRLGQVGRCVRGLVYSPDNIVAHGLLVLRSSNIQNGLLSFLDNVYVNCAVDNDFLSQKGDILICVRNGSKKLIGKSAIIKSNHIKSTHGAFMTVFRSEQNNFIQHLIKSDIFFKFVSKDIGATINSINNNNLLNYVFTFPPLPEQKKIASILSSIDEMIEKTTAQAAKLKDLKTSLIQELLTHGIGHSEFKDSPVGRIPVGWEVYDLGDLAQKIEGGGTPSRDNPIYWNGSIPWATVKDLKEIVLTRTEEFISINGLENSASKVVPANTMIIACRMAVGKAVFFNKEVAINQDLKAFYPKKNVYWRFLIEWYLFKSKYIEGLGTGSTVKGIRLDDLKTLSICLPPLEEQKEIAKILISVDQRIALTNQKLSTLHHIKKALMQDLLTGKKRVMV